MFSSDLWKSWSIQVLYWFKYCSTKELVLIHVQSFCKVPSNITYVPLLYMSGYFIYFLRKLVSRSRLPRKKTEPDLLKKYDLQNSFTFLLFNFLEILNKYVKPHSLVFLIKIQIFSMKIRTLSQTTI